MNYVYIYTQYRLRPRSPGSAHVRLGTRRLPKGPKRNHASVSTSCHLSHDLSHISHDLSHLSHDLSDPSVGGCSGAGVSTRSLRSPQLRSPKSRSPKLRSPKLRSPKLRSPKLRSPAGVLGPIGDMGGRAHANCTSRRVPRWPSPNFETGTQPLTP